MKTNPNYVVIGRGIATAALWAAVAFMSMYVKGDNMAWVLIAAVCASLTIWGEW